MNGIDVLGLAFFVVILVCFAIIYVVQYNRYVPGTERLLVLNTRTATFLPLYALFMLISLARPESLAAMTVPTAVVEAYSFYCFFAMIVTNLHGPTGAVAAFKSTGKELCCCNPCCPADHVRFYKKSIWALFHFMVTRVVITIIAAIAFYTHTMIGKGIYVFLNVVAAVILFYSLLHLVLFYENVYSDCVNLYGIAKFALLKFSVGLIVLQGLICQFMVETNREPYNDDSKWSAQQKTERGYCILVLLEFILLVIPYLYTFVYQMEPPRRKPLVSDMSTSGAPLTFGSYTCEILKFHDVFGTLTYTSDLESTEIQKLSSEKYSDKY